MNELLIEQRC